MCEAFGRKVKLMDTYLPDQVPSLPLLSTVTCCLRRPLLKGVLELGGDRPKSVVSLRQMWGHGIVSEGAFQFDAFVEGAAFAGCR